MIAANVGTGERPCVCFVDAGLEVLGSQDKVYLVVNLPIRDIPGCCLRQLVGVASVGKGERWLFANFRSLHPLSFVSPMPIFLLSLPSVGMRQGLLWHSNRLELQVCPSWESLHDAIELLIELFVV